MMASYQQTSTNQHAQRAVLSLAAALIASGLTACYADLSDAPHPKEAPMDESTQQTASGDTQTVPLDSNGLYYGAITANGTGCPSKTWLVRISEDRLVFTMTFSAFVARVDQAKTVDIKDCQLSVRLHSPKNRSFAVKAFGYLGHANLERGVTGRQMANYYFQGTPVMPRQQARTELAGPYDDAYMFRDQIPAEDRVWSPCGLVRDLQITTRIVLNNGDEKTSGLIDLSSVDGNVVVELDSRLCTPESGPADGGAPDAGKPNVVKDAGAVDAGAVDAGAAPIPDSGMPSGANDRPTNVRVNPMIVESAQRFLVNWTPLAADLTAKYKMQLRYPVDDGFGLIWESPWTDDSPLTYGGPALRPGRYQVFVLARTKTGEVSSDGVTFTVRDSNAQPSL